MTAEPDVTEDRDSRRARLQREGVARGEVLVHSGALDLFTALIVLIGLLLTRGDTYDDTYALVQPILAVALAAFSLRGGLRLLVYTP